MKGINYITITTSKSSKTFTFNSKAKLTMVIVLSVFLVVFLTNISGVYYLKSQISVLDLKKNKLENEIKELNSYNQLLVEDIEHKNFELAELQRLEALIKQVSDSKYYTKEEQEKMMKQGEIKSSKNHINYAKHTIQEKTFILSIIPSGNPLDSKARVTSNFGWRTHPILHKRIMHKGLDFSAPIGTPIYATASGLVSYARTTSGFGKLLRIKNFAAGFETLFAHLNSFNVEEGDYVSKGDLIGFTGNTGRSTGPHLHYEVRYRNKSLNPKYFVTWGMDSYNVAFNNVGEVKWQQILKNIDYLMQHRQQLSLKKANSKEYF